MIIALAGPHGVGKTTALKQLSVYCPTVIVSNSDAITGPPGSATQMERMKVYENVLNIAEVSAMPVLVDRSPYDFLVYMDYLGIDDPEVVEFREHLIKRYDAMEHITVLVTEDTKEIIRRIVNRGRDFSKWELETLDGIVARFYSTDFIERSKAVIVRSDELVPYLEKVIKGEK